MRRAKVYPIGRASAAAGAALALLTSTALPAEALDLARPSPAAGLNEHLVQVAATIHHGPHGTTVHHGAQGVVRGGPHGTSVHHGPQAAKVHPGPQGATIHHGPQGTYAGGRPGYRRPYRAARRPASAPAHAAYRPPAPVQPPAATAPWTRPHWYSWAPGGAVAAGVAAGFLTAAAVPASTPPPPGAGLCWYYRDPSQRSGFWDVCP